MQVSLCSEIAAIVREHEIDRALRVGTGLSPAPGRRRPGWSQMTLLKDDATLASEMGFDVTWGRTTPAVGGRHGRPVANQARIHPQHYLAGLALMHHCTRWTDLRIQRRGSSVTLRWASPSTGTP